MNAYQVKALHEMGINIAQLGCVMLDVEAPPVEIPEAWSYSSTHPDRDWISGVQLEHHVTLLYGLLEPAGRWRSAVDEVLEGWTPGLALIESVSYFPSTFDDEPYACIVGHLEVTPNLLDAHQRLSLLPHIDTHPDYRPHVTLAYVNKRSREDALRALQSFEGRTLAATGLNYGRPA